MMTRTEIDFSKARNKAFINEIQHFLNPEEAKMISFGQIKGMLKPTSQHYVGMKTIPINEIVGSEGRYKDFDNRFFPKNSFLKERWERVDDAVIKDVILPPIKVYELGGLYFVRDGNHRVSVAKSKGVEFIDADVITLESEIKLKATRNLPEMIKEIINYEKRNFYSETMFGDITEYWDLDFSSAGQYDKIYNHILTHKYFMNQQIPNEIPIQEAIKSWFDSVYMPVIKAIDRNNVMKHFKHNTKSDLYLWIIHTYDDLKKKFGKADLDEVVEDMKEDKKTKKLPAFFSKLLSGIKIIINRKK